IEPSPALWQAVRARIAAEKVLAPTPALALASRLRATVAAWFALPRFSFSPALAGSLALVAVCALAGWLLFSAPRTQDNQTAHAPQQSAPEVALKMPEIPDPNASKATTETLDGKASVTAAEPRDARVDDVSTVSTTARARRAAAPASVVEAGEQLAAGEPVELNHEHPTLHGEVLGEAVAANGAAVAEEIPRRPLSSLEDIEVARHLERAQLLLRSFRNADGDSADIAYEKRVSKELLSENIVLRRESEGSPTTTKQLLNTLEPFLLDIANLEDDASNEDVRAIKERMQKKEIIAALRVY
ncbi:MAG TPA: anti-sigma factor, partial [Pyrinomonadaceae bacterium]|nr:anti-sigma factor [Pyrinomonadaceae bacterium]